ncbi:MAG: hypothetical protein A2W05_09265 [Candidatus Schekmanbacteria bacterium RBG_16_38_10]|uniref:Uncharacterized protein n=1 Tax=Candidatus Schekmanbacteria bacterium RBG_16_38_10 TaxID=1817879 RepID=A0A1F7RXW4_9BACT|nr:MAG: hypothetical protein A2W05_09265 [Candidatus Schekmanbacteria bacterium RBG_16_38_10]
MRWGTISFLLRSFCRSEKNINFSAESLKKQEGVRLFYPGNIMNIQVERANIPAGGGWIKERTSNYSLST